MCTCVGVSVCICVHTCVCVGMSVHVCEGVSVPVCMCVCTVWLCLRFLGRTLTPVLSEILLRNVEKGA